LGESLRSGQGGEVAAWALASLAGLMIVSKASYSHTYAETRGMQEMAAQVEMV
jgi:hypothetical protein